MSSKPDPMHRWPISETCTRKACAFKRIQNSKSSNANLMPCLRYSLDLTHNRLRSTLNVDLCRLRLNRIQHASLKIITSPQHSLNPSYLHVPILPLNGFVYSRDSALVRFKEFDKTIDGAPFRFDFRERRVRL